MPLNLAEKNKLLQVRNLGGKPEVRRHLESLGISPGAFIIVIKELNSSLIVSIKGVKLAIDSNTARSIFI